MLFYALTTFVLQVRWPIRATRQFESFVPLCRYDGSGLRPYFGDHALLQWVSELFGDKESITAILSLQKKIYVLHFVVESCLIPSAQIFFL